MTGRETANLVLKRMLKVLLKIPPLKKILKFWDWKKAAKLIKKQTNSKTEFKPVI